MQTLETKRKNIVNFFLKKNILLSQELLEQLEDKKKFSEICKLIESKDPKSITVLNKKIKELLIQPASSKPNWSEIEKIKTISKKKKDSSYNALFDPILTPELQTQPKEKKPEIESNVKIIFSYKSKAKKREAQDFIDYFNGIYKTIGRILKQRPELQNTISISRLLAKKSSDQVAVIGMVRDKQYTKNGNCMLTIEDETGYVRAIINKSKPDLFRIAKDVVLDEVLGILGVNRESVIFVNSMLSPDVPITEEIKKANEEVYALFLSDLHVGSENFLEEDFKRFLKWINGDLGNGSQRQIAAKVKYIFILGDLVDGCGVYPDQEKELKIKDIKDQYKECANLLNQIPKDIKLISPLISY